METRAQIEASCMEMNLIWQSELPYYSSQKWWHERGEIVEFPWVTNVILAVKITKLGPHSGYYLKLAEKLITAKQIMKLEAPDIVEKYLKMRE